MLRVLQVLPALNICGGIESYVMNYYRHLDKEKIQSDFITHTTLECTYRKEIEEMGGSIYEFPPFKISKIINIIKLIDVFLKKNHKKYDIIHCHMANAAVFYFFFAKKYNLKIRVLHSHQPSAADKLSHKIRNYPLLLLGNILATHRLACSDLAGKFLFKRKSFLIINNAIEVEKFAYDKHKRKMLRNLLAVDNKKVIGHIGRFCRQKNQLYLLDIFSECMKKDKNYHLVMIGSGEDESVIKQKINQLGLEKNVSLLGNKQNVNDYYQIFDYFVFPSLYEGIGIVLIEAQCSGLMVFASSDDIPHSVKMTENFQFISLKENAKKWAESIIDNENYIRRSQVSNIKQFGYSIVDNSNKLENFYLGCIDK